ncbi:ClpP-like prohead protease/major capsid protein fusion protein [Massilia endophytica]|uniref:ClpP-like prohead protease/major capsid protein fusion protein n=1 Tax=Massilia endophytica TaxID=2899220 RepID=UPI001E3B2FED|nr:ClpP-like prohead protease/major capsid protein fusion protein [Massilia endophytica]UGQ45086.1 ATP-dependent Clp protease proteolytic subunit [Massilia endophytica]
MSGPATNPSAHPAKWYSVRAQTKPAASTGARSAEILIYGDIGESWYEDTVAARDFVREIDALDVDHITIRINSFGGSVPDGIAIFNAIRRHKATVTTIVDSVAASVASLIAMAGDSIEMAENALLMIHAPWLNWVSGNAVQLREYADQLDSFAEAMATSYAVRSNDKAAALALLSDGVDHWYTAEQALAEKLIDVVVPALPLAAAATLHGSIKARFASFPMLSEARAAAVPPAPITSTPEESNTMSAATPAAAAQPLNEEQIRAQALAADKARRTAIAQAFAKFTNVEGVQALQTACVDDLDCTVEKANKQLLAHLGAGTTPVAGSGPRIVTLEDERDKFRAGVTASIMARAGLAKDDTANNFRSYSLMDIARASAERAGIKALGMDKMALVAAAFTGTGSDFPILLTNIAEKAMMKGYEEADETFQKWTSTGVLTDFKIGKRIELGSFPSLDLIRDGGEYHNAQMGERGESVQLATYGKMFNLTRQTIINDDLDAFTKIPRAMGRAAIRTVGNLVYAVLTQNQVMSDGVALFHADHKNLLAGGGLSTAAVDAMRVAMATQKDGEAILNIRLANILVPIALEGAARVVRDSEYDVGAANKNNTVPNSVRGTFEVISDARLDAASPTIWYGAANKDMHDTVEVSYLDGVQSPTLERQEGWNVDGTEFKVRLDAGVKALSFRTMAKNPGA